VIMDLLATVRKEGSRGGRGDFKWSDVQSSSHRENYLGHSLMAPVGRWQQGRDLSWYAKGDADANNDEDPAAKAARERKEEIRRVKEAEEDALAKALGLPVAPRNNANLVELGMKRNVGNALKEATTEDDASDSRGLGFGRASGPQDAQSSSEVLNGTIVPEDKELGYALKEYRRRHGDRKDRARSHSRDRHHRNREKREHRHRNDDRERRRRRSRSPRRDWHRIEKSRSRDRRDHDRKTDREASRSQSPSYRRDRDSHRDRDRSSRHGR
jgi:hypothetical protein